MKGIFIVIIVFIIGCVSLLGCSESKEESNEILFYDINFTYFEDLRRILGINTGHVGRIFFDGNDINELGRTLYDFDETIGNRMRETKRAYIALLITVGYRSTISVSINSGRVFVIVQNSLTLETSDLVLLVSVSKENMTERLLLDSDIHHIIECQSGTLIMGVPLHRFSQWDNINKSALRLKYNVNIWIILNIFKHVLEDEGERHYEKSINYFDGSTNDHNVIWM